jgi:hypothetical protein
VRRIITQQTPGEASISVSLGPNGIKAIVIDDIGPDVTELPLLDLRPFLAFAPTAPNGHGASVDTDEGDPGEDDSSKNDPDSAPPREWDVESPDEAGAPDEDADDEVPVPASPPAKAVRPATKTLTRRTVRTGSKAGAAGGKARNKMPAMNLLLQILEEEPTPAAAKDRIMADFGAAKSTANYWYVKAYDFAKSGPAPS